jgi:hypothetical protein
VRPILKAHCFHCHGEESSPKAGLDLRLVRFQVKGGDGGEALVPGHPDDSLIWDRVSADEMPPVDKKLSATEKATLRRWIEQGAATARPEPETLARGSLTPDELDFWSFQPVRRPTLPAVNDAGRIRTPIDRFVLARLEAEGLGLAPEADRATLLRRLTFGLTGLPPTPEAIAEFEADPRADAYERAVERLLAAPRYGEQWARHWLDVAGYADSDGYTPRDGVRPHAFRYRDYLVQALNADRPWNELIVEQLAGDELVAPPYQNLAPADQDRLIATGFLRTAPDGTSDDEADPKQSREDVVAESLKVVSSAFLGLTVGCAQCHNHRYDPITQEDYYRLRAVFDPAYDVEQWRKASQRLVSLWTDADRQRAEWSRKLVDQAQGLRGQAIDQLVDQTLEKELAVAPEERRAALREARKVPEEKRTDEQKALLKEYPRVLVNPSNVSLYDGTAHGRIMATFESLIDQAQAVRPPEAYIACLTEVPGRVPASRLLSRGDFNQPRQEVAPGELTAVIAATGTPEIPADDPALPTTGRRLAYARHLASGRHPLVARVLVNRVWMHHLGRGLVATPADFGRLGERPSHPELLDWLADEFVASGWSLKHLHRLIVGSATYRQASARTEAQEARDPQNRLLGRMPVRRLRAEELRDAILATSGGLVERLAGPGAPVSIDSNGQVVIGIIGLDGDGKPENRKQTVGLDEFRRTLYLQVRRTLPLNLLEVFDAPLLTPNCERRTDSTSAPQSLALLNGEFVLEQARAFAQRVEREAGPEPAARIERAWRLALGRGPSPAELASATRFLEAQAADLARLPATDPPVPAAHRALALLCQALLGSNAFLYVD